MPHLIKTGNTILRSGDTVFGGYVTAYSRAVNVIPIGTRTNAAVIGVVASEKFGCFFITNNLDQRVDIYDSLTYQLINTLTGQAFSTASNGGGGVALDDVNNRLFVKTTSSTISVYTYTDPRAGAFTLSTTIPCALSTAFSVSLFYRDNIILAVLRSVNVNNVQIIDSTTKTSLYLGQPQNYYYNGCYIASSGEPILSNSYFVTRYNSIYDLTANGSVGVPSGDILIRGMTVNEPNNAIIIGTQRSNNPDRLNKSNYAVFGTAQYVGMDFTCFGGCVNKTDNAVLVVDIAKTNLYVLK